MPVPISAPGLDRINRKAFHAFRKWFHVSRSPLGKPNNERRVASEDSHFRLIETVGFGLRD